MKVLMLGWEYPPHISGGLGTACEGLTRALSRLNVSIRFMVPRLYGGEDASHMVLVDSFAGAERLPGGTLKPAFDLSKIQFDRVPAFLAPYWTPEAYAEHLKQLRELKGKKAAGVPGAEKMYEQMLLMAAQAQQAERYGSSIFDEVHRYASNVVALAGSDGFDIVHAHDWMTYPAGMALAEASGKPLVLHVHSLEYDRSGASVNQQIDEIERAGLRRADVVIAVSYYTASVIHREHGIPLEKIAVVHNGVYPHQAIQKYRHEANGADKIVLFLGRITFQKGPDYFVEAAARVIPHVPDVLFVMAGSGDMLQRMIDRVHQLGIDKHFRFPGFLRGEELEKALSIADLYVMPSVSEPFGISALEAVSYDTPVIISRQSGVSEVLGHALKADFWDVERLADLIINGLIHEELRADMIGMARDEVKKLRWDASALKTLEIYSRLVN